MISKEDLETIKSYLEKAENPLFLYDDDNDGLCSYLLFKKFCGRGKGVIVKARPHVDEFFVHRVNEYNPDIIFILDKPIVKQEFIDNVNVPIVWLDHHPPSDVKGVKYFNPLLKKKDGHGMSTSYWCYKAVGGELWIATVGTISDWVVPEWMDEFKKKYPGMVEDMKTPEKILFETKLGKLCRLFSFFTRGKISDIKDNIKLIEKIEDPNEILDCSSDAGKRLVKNIEKIKKEFDKLLVNAIKSVTEDKLFIFTYVSKNYSFTSDISNELVYRFPNKFIIVGREKEGEIKMSLRSEKYKVRDILEEALEKVEGYGGGHEKACGANVAVGDFDKFTEIIKKKL